MTNTVINIYDKIAEEYAKVFDTDFTDGPFLDKFSNYLEPNTQILDVGCGTGREAEYLTKKGFSVEGIDLSERMLQIATKNYPDLVFRKMDIRNIKYPENSFGAVWAGYSLFHIKKEEFIQTIKSLKLILKYRGIFGLVMQEGKGEVEIEEPLMPGEKLYVHLYESTELGVILENSGFDIIDRGIKPPKLVGELPYNKLLIIARKK